MGFLGAFDHLYAAALAFLTLAAGRARGAPEPEAPWPPRRKRAVYIGNSVFLWIVAGGAIALWGVKNRPWAALGLGAPRWSWWAVALAVVAAALWLRDVRRRLVPERRAETARRWRRETPSMPATSGELGGYALLAVSAGVCEEIAYRGYAISYLAVLLGGADVVLGGGAAIETAGWLLVPAVGIPALLFGIAHLAQGMRGALGAALGAITFGLLFVGTGSVWPGIVLHTAMDFYAGVFGRPLMRGEA